MTLCELGKKYNCTKGTMASYLEFYDQLFKGMDCNAILEIGIYQGASLAMWRDYFKCRVVGIDVKPIIVEGAVSLQGDAYTPAMVQSAKAYGPYDIIIDDGSHKIEDIRFVIDDYRDLLSENGILIIEDLFKEGIPGLNIGDDLRQSYYVDRRHVSGNKQDMLFVIDRRKHAPVSV